ncbi:MAG: putative ester cyclase [Chthonomonadales bacterium]|nr:putative ester cyclase [Chthonomonadales bacterium]
MSLEHDNEALTRCWYEEVWNQKRPERIAELLASDVIAHGLGPNAADLHGPEAFRQTYETFTGAFPDLKITIEQCVAKGDMVVVLLRCEATHGGDHLGVPATGKPVTFPVMSMARYREGKIVEGWNVLDLLTAFHQMGMAPTGEKRP